MKKRVKIFFVCLIKIARAHSTIVRAHSTIVRAHSTIVRAHSTIVRAHSTIAGAHSKGNVSFRVCAYEVETSRVV